MNARPLRLALSILVGFGLLNNSYFTFAATENGEIQARPAPVFRCPGLPCAAPNVFNISVAVQYNASAADLAAIQDMISAGSAVLFDVTDGQAEIGEALIYNNAFGTAADLRIYPSTSDTWWQANTGNWKVGGSIHVSISYILAESAPGESLAHEFVHLVFDARDEYQTLGGAGGTASCPDAAMIATGQANCLMDQGGTGANDGPFTELCWGHGDPANLADLSGGNHDATLVTEQSQSRANRSCWDQVIWSWPDQFTMPVGAPDPAAGGAVVDPTQFVIADTTRRVVLVLDASGSMSSESPSRMERLQVAASDFAALAPDTMELGIVSFSTDAEAASGHANVAIDALDAAHRADCAAAITGLTPGGWTAIGLGLQKARDMIIAAGGVTASTYIVLMTDGLNNRPLPDYEAQLQGVLDNLLADGIPVYVTCTGGDPGLASQCAEIAAATGGFSVDSADAAELPQAFTDFHEKISGREAIDSASGDLLSPTPEKVFVDQGSESATFTLLWSDSKASANLTVIDPFGNQHPSVRIPQGRFLRIIAPPAGEYLMVVSNVVNATSNSTYVARAYTRHQLNSLTAAVRYPTVLPNQPIYVYAYPRSVGGGITQPTTTGITGTVLLPNNQTGTIVLQDMGLGGDEIAGDGIFTGVCSNTSLKGPYRFNLRADINNWGQSTDRHVFNPTLRSPRFSREVRLSAAVGVPSDLAGVRVSINEWMASNTRTLTNPATGRFDDWFELYNPNSFPVDLSGWLLTDSLSNSTPYVIPRGYTIPAKEFRLVWGDGLNPTGSPDLHVNFTLNNNGGVIALLAPDGRVANSVTFGKQTDDVSQGRSPDGGVFIFSLPRATPRTPNPLIQPPSLRATATASRNQVAVIFNTTPGLTYRVEYKNGLNARNWTQLAPAQVATGASLSVPDTIVPGTQRFYRVVIVP
ncbi:MAG TPA: lamin tail domain-containing protein [Verrucomicrobiae bacterium]